ncbi:MAG: hypothetical protein AAF587_40390 [Bacteroidota bacterium]
MKRSMIFTLTFLFLAFSSLHAGQSASSHALPQQAVSSEQSDISSPKEEKTNGQKSTQSALLMLGSFGAAFGLAQIGIPFLPILFLIGGAFFAARAINFGRKAKRRAKKAAKNNDSTDSSAKEESLGSLGMALGIGAIAAGIAAIIGLGVLFINIFRYS